MFKVCFTLEPHSDKPYVCQVAVPNREGRFYVYKYAFSDRKHMFEMAFTYYNAYAYTPDIVDFHFNTIRDYEKQPELPFAKWNDPKGGVLHIVRDGQE